MSAMRPMRFRAIVVRVGAIVALLIILVWTALLAAVAVLTGAAVAAPPEPICLPADQMPAPEDSTLGTRLRDHGGPARWLVMVDGNGGWFLFSHDPGGGEMCLLDMGDLFELGDGLAPIGERS